MKTIKNWESFNEAKENNENLVIALRWHEADPTPPRYGENYRMIFRGFDGKGFKTKGLAKKDLSMLKKFTKSIKNAKTFAVEIDEYDNLETYKYVSMGPSWSCSNYEIDVERFQEFIEKETLRLKEGKERREREKNRKSINRR